jgi:hypothetical protein
VAHRILIEQAGAALDEIDVGAAEVAVPTSARSTGESFELRWEVMQCQAERLECIDPERPIPAAATHARDLIWTQPGLLVIPAYGRGPQSYTHPDWLTHTRVKVKNSLRDDVASELRFYCGHLDVQFSWTLWRLSNTWISCKTRLQCTKAGLVSFIQLLCSLPHSLPSLSG